MSVTANNKNTGVYLRAWTVSQIIYLIDSG